MADKLKPKSAPAPAPAIDVQTAGFDELRQAFETSQCDTESFALAAWMYTRFPEEAGKLLPAIKGSELTYDGSNADKAQNLEWAAALLAAKQLKATAGITFEVVTEDQVHDKACKIYTEAQKAGAGCRAF